ncbi:hypothetical protein CWI36_0510p0010 [Hamiltosporidium magnivora]|uniref:Uncharacterized protein n=1 Tax=Hamiltosporidium magnivora TaxID=148818 RepID=A0A4Q9LDV6_9MICR|nr:hypothetical protein CWI36_0510p0010 [Hamiltosporidium magnivora]
MKISQISKTSKDNISISTLLGSKIYISDSKSIYFRNVYNYDQVKFLKFKSKKKIDGLYTFGEYLIVLCGNVVFLCQQSEDVLIVINEFLVEDIPTRVIISSISDENFIIFIFNADYIQIYSKKDGLELIEVNNKIKNINTGNITDIFNTNDKSYVLTENGFIFDIPSILYSYRCILKNPLKMIPEPVHFIYEKADKIIVLNNKICICYGTGYEIYKKEFGVLNLDHIYKKNNANISIYKNNLFCYGDELILIEDKPLLLSKDIILGFYGNICVSEKYIFYIEFQEKNLNQYFGRKSSLIKERDPNDRASMLLESVSNRKRELLKIKEKTNKMSDLIFEKIFTKFRTELLDEYKIIFIELNSIKESFPEKENVLISKENDLKRKVEFVENKYQILNEKLCLLEERINVIYKNLKNDSFDEKLQSEIVAIRKELESKELNRCDRKNSLKDLLSKLRLQKQILSGMVFRSIKDRF